jgi:hypothetical protein
MKKQLLVLVFAILTISACKKDSSKIVTQKDFIGTWYATEKLTNNKWQSVTSTCSDGMNAHFEVDLVYSSYLNCNAQANYTGTYVYSNNVITCKVGAAVITYKIIDLIGDNATFELIQDYETAQYKAVRR